MKTDPNMALPRPFWTLFTIQFIGAFCDNVYRNALLIYATFVLLGAGALPVVSLAAALFILPFFLFSGMAGRWADRVDQAQAIRVLKTLEIPLMLAAVLALASGMVVPMLASLFLLGTQAAFFGPLKYSVLPRLLSAASLSLGNGVVEAGTFIAILLGTLVGGLLIMLPHGVVAVGGVLVTLSALAYLLSRTLPSLPPVADAPMADMPWQLIRQIPVLQASILGIAFLWFMGSAVLTLLPDFVRSALQAPPVYATLFMALFSIGVAVGAMLSAILRRHLTDRTLVCGGLLALCLSAFVIWPLLAWQNLVLIAAVMLALSISAGLFSVPLYTALQRHSPEAMRARIVAANNVVNAGFMVLSALLIMAAHALDLSAAQILALCGGLGLPVLMLLIRKF